jgi:signal transduction histidine kinase
MRTRLRRWRQRPVSIRARLFRSHMAVVWLSLTASFVLLLLLGALSSITNPPVIEPMFGAQARAVSFAVGPLLDEAPADTLPTSLRGMVAQQPPTDPSPALYWSFFDGIAARVEPRVQHIVVLDAGGQIVASSHPQQVAPGTALARLDPPTWQEPLRRALRGVQDTGMGHLVTTNAAGDTALAAYPIFAADGTVRGAVGLRSAPIQLPSGPVGQPALTLLLLALIGISAVLSSLGVVVSAFVVSLGLSALFARRLARRLAQLEQATAAIADGTRRDPLPEQPADEIGRLSARFNAMAAHLRRLEQARQTFTLNICHELRTPVAVMQARLESSGLLERDDPAIATVYQETGTLSRLIDDLFHLAQARHPEMELHLAPLPLRAAVDDALAGVADLAWRTRRVQVVCDVPADLIVRADATRLGQIVRNLVLNALRHTPEGGMVRVAAAAQGQQIQLAVADTGVGIAAADLPHVFAPHRRGDQSDGSGLGLAIVRELVERQGGSIQVESTPGAGTTFTLTLPAAEIG